MTEKDLELLNQVDEHITKMNEGISAPFSFSWVLPSNHRAGRSISYIGVRLNKSMVQETKDEILRNDSLSMQFFFGQVSALLRNCSTDTTMERLHEIWTQNFTNMLARYITATDNISRGKDNPNFHGKL